MLAGLALLEVVDLADNQVTDLDMLLYLAGAHTGSLTLLMADASVDLCAVSPASLLMLCRRHTRSSRAGRMHTCRHVSTHARVCTHVCT